MTTGHLVLYIEKRQANCFSKEDAQGEICSNGWGLCLAVWFR